MPPPRNANACRTSGAGGETVWGAVAFAVSLAAAACGSSSGSSSCWNCVEPDRGRGASGIDASSSLDDGGSGVQATSEAIVDASAASDANGLRQSEAGSSVLPLLLQGRTAGPFEGEVDPWWTVLASKVDDFSAMGVDAVWIPPPYKGKGAFDVGYGVDDRYDLGEFDQRGTTRTRYGTLAELEALIAKLHAKNIGVHADIVMNHALASDGTESLAVDGGTVRVPTRFDFPGRGTKYSAFAWNSTRFNGCNTPNGWVAWASWDFAPYADGDAWDNLLGCEIRYRDGAVQDEMVAWGKWITAKLALDGYRLDATKHMLTSFVNRWLDEVKEKRFAVSEAWFGNLDNMRAYARATGRRTHLFDVPLHYAFHAMSQGNGSYDMRGLVAAGLAGVDPELAVTFVDNHDTDAPGGALRSPIENFKDHAYAYLLTREGTVPMLYYRDLYEYGHAEAVKALLTLRRDYAFGPGRENPASDANVYVYSRAGDANHAGLLLILSDGPKTTKTITTPWKYKALVDGTGRHGGTVTTDANGTAEFPVEARSYSNT